MEQISKCGQTRQKKRSVKKSPLHPQVKPYYGLHGGSTATCVWWPWTWPSLLLYYSTNYTCSCSQCHNFDMWADLTWYIVQTEARSQCLSVIPFPHCDQHRYVEPALSLFFILCHKFCIAKHSSTGAAVVHGTAVYRDLQTKCWQVLCLGSVDTCSSSPSAVSGPLLPP